MRKGRDHEAVDRTNKLVSPADSHKQQYCDDESITFDISRPLEDVREVREGRDHEATVFRRAPIVDDQYLAHPRDKAFVRRMLRKVAEQTLSQAKHQIYERVKEGRPVLSHRMGVGGHGWSKAISYISGGRLDSLGTLASKTFRLKIPLPGALSVPPVVP